MTTIRTEDGRSVTAGETVFNYYDRKWGSIRSGSIDSEGWFTFDHEDGTSATLNGARISTYDPNGSEPEPKPEPELPSGRGALSHEDAAALAQHFAPDWLRGVDDARRSRSGGAAYLTREDTLHLAAVYSTEGDLPRAAYWGGYTAQIVREGRS